jgi:hypothetical protein
MQSNDFGNRFFTTCAAGIAAVLVIVATAGCDRGPARVVAPSIPAKSTAAAAIQQFDKNNDGKLTGAELDACPSLKNSVDLFGNKPHDTVTADMIAERISAWRQSGVARMAVTCRITRNDKPLAGAVVKLVPEQFLGGSLPMGQGKTDNSGIAAISMVDGSDPPGMPCGFYRVEVTKPGDSVPARYNTATTLGKEVGAAKSSNDYTLKFDLQY